MARTGLEGALLGLVRFIRLGREGAMLGWLRSVGGKARSREGKVFIFHGRRLVFGRFVVSGPLITVTADSGSKTAHLAGSPAEALAKVLLRELADARRA
jgi:hypothetical protein